MEKKILASLASQPRYRSAVWLPPHRYRYITLNLRTIYGRFAHQPVKYKAFGQQQLGGLLGLSSAAALIKSKSHKPLAFFIVQPIIRAAGGNTALAALHVGWKGACQAQQPRATSRASYRHTAEYRFYISRTCPIVSASQPLAAGLALNRRLIYRSGIISAMLDYCFVRHRTSQGGRGIPSLCALQ